jgi:NTE family protein
MTKTMVYTERKVGLALSGGGARGLAHIGVLKALEAAGIHPHCIAGTSMGAVVGALYAAGHPVDRLEEEALQFTGLGKLLRFVDWLPSWRGLMNGQSIYNYLEALLGPNLTFADLDLPLGVTATDLVSGQAVNLTSGSVIDAVRASLSLLGIFTPLRRQGQRLVDGGFLNHLPVDLARTLGADVVIAVDVQGSEAYLGDEEVARITRPFFPNFTPPVLQDMMQINAVMVREITRLRLAQACPEVVLTPLLGKEIGTLRGLDQAELIIEKGWTAAQAALPQIEHVLCQGSDRGA